MTVIYQLALLKMVMKNLHVQCVCVLCNEVLQNISMAPSKLQRHFETKRSQHKGKPLSFFPTYVKQLIVSEGIRAYKIYSENEDALMVSM